MAYLNKQERDELLNELEKAKTFKRIQGKLRRKDPQGRLAYFRNVQETDRWMTRYVLEGLGTQVTLVEKFNLDRGKRKFDLVEIVVEPTPQNRL